MTKLILAGLIAVVGVARADACFFKHRAAGGDCAAPVGCEHHHHHHHWRGGDCCQGEVPVTYSACYAPVQVQGCPTCQQHAGVVLNNGTDVAGGNFTMPQGWTEATPTWNGQTWVGPPLQAGVARPNNTSAYPPQTGSAPLPNASPPQPQGR